MALGRGASFAPLVEMLRRHDRAKKSLRTQDGPWSSDVQKIAVGTALGRSSGHAHGERAGLWAGAGSRASAVQPVGSW